MCVLFFLLLRQITLLFLGYLNIYNASDVFFIHVITMPIWFTCSVFIENSWSSEHVNNIWVWTWARRNIESTSDSSVFHFDAFDAGPHVVALQHHLTRGATVKRTAAVVHAQQQLKEDRFIFFCTVYIGMTTPPMALLGHGLGGGRKLWFIILSMCKRVINNMNSTNVRFAYIILCPTWLILSRVILILLFFKIMIIIS